MSLPLAGRSRSAGRLLTDEWIGAAAMIQPTQLKRDDQTRGVMRRRTPNTTTKRNVVPPAIPVPDQSDERRLVELARQDANAFAELYRRYVERIHAYAFRRSGSRVVAEDVTSATFENALRGLGTYRWSEPGIGPWLFRIASNEFANHHRGIARQDRVVQSLHQAAQLGVSSQIADMDSGDHDLRAALAALRPRYQQALTLRYFADLTNEEAALAMGVSRRTMAVIVHRGAAALRRTLETMRDDQEVMKNG